MYGIEPGAITKTKLGEPNNPKEDIKQNTKNYSINPK